MVDVSIFSGEQFEIESGAHRAVIVELGGGLRSYTVDGRDVIDGYGVEEMCNSGRGQLLAPWPNRIEDGNYEFNRTRHQVPLTEPEAHNAIHGLVRWDAWQLRNRSTDRVELAHTIRPQPGYPFAVALTVAYVVSSAGLTVSMEATNIGNEPCPYGCGMHPYFTLGQDVDALTLSMPAERVLVADQRGLPVSAKAVGDTPYDFRRVRMIGATVLDHCFTELARDGDGAARIELASSEHRTAVWMDRSFGYVMLYTGDARPDIARRAIAIEPMTCPPNAFRAGTDVIVLQPGESATNSWGVTPD